MRGNYFAHSFSDTVKEVIIGIPARPIPAEFMAQLKKKREEEHIKDYKYFIDSGYVHFLKQSGARVVPLVISDTAEMTRYKLASVNGILYTGGSKVDDEFRVFCKDILLEARK